MGRVVALIDDLFFQMKVTETAKHLGVEFKVAGNGDVLDGMLEPPTKLVIVDLNSKSSQWQPLSDARNSEGAASGCVSVSCADGTGGAGEGGGCDGGPAAVGVHAKAGGHFAKRKGRVIVIRNLRVNVRRVMSVWLALLILAMACGASAQIAADAGPAFALRDALVAACSQNSGQFVRELTARNAEAFSRMTPPARATLLKRFVLLDNPGTPSAKNDADGRLLVTCATREVTTLMELDKAEHRDNLAFIPLTIKDANDTTGASAHQVTMGMVREGGQWKILSLGLLFLDLPSLETEWDRAEIKSNEQAAIAALKNLVQAIETYRKTYTRLPDALQALGPAANGAAKADKAGLVDPELAAGLKGGYSYRYVIVGASTSGAPAKYEVAAIPAEYGRTGQRSFFYDSSGVMHAGDHKGSIEAHWIRN